MSTQLLNKIIYHQQQVLNSLQSLVKLFPQNAEPNQIIKPESLDTSSKNHPSILQLPPSFQKLSKPTSSPRRDVIPHHSHPEENAPTIAHFPLSIRQKGSNLELPILLTRSSSKIKSDEELQPIPHVPLAIRSGIYPKKYQLASHTLESLSLPSSHQETTPIAHLPLAIRQARKQNLFSDVVRAQQPSSPKLAGRRQSTHLTQNDSFFSSSFQSSILSPSDSSLYPSPEPCSLPVFFSPFSPPLTPSSELTTKHKNNFKSNNIYNNKPDPNKFKFNKEKSSKIPSAAAKISKQVKFPNLQKFSAKGRHFREQLRQIQLSNAPPKQRIIKPSAQKENKSTGLTLLFEKNGASQKVSLESKKHRTWIKRSSSRQASDEEKGSPHSVEDFEKTSKVSETKKVEIDSTNSFFHHRLCNLLESFQSKIDMTHKFSNPNKGALPPFFSSTLSPPLSETQIKSIFFVCVFVCGKLTAQRSNPETLQINFSKETRETAKWLILCILDHSEFQLQNFCISAEPEKHRQTEITSPFLKIMGSIHFNSRWEFLPNQGTFLSPPCLNLFHLFRACLHACETLTNFEVRNQCMTMLESSLHLAKKSLIWRACELVPTETKDDPLISRNLTFHHLYQMLFENDIAPTHRQSDSATQRASFAQETLCRVLAKRLIFLSCVFCVSVYSDRNRQELGKIDAAEQKHVPVLQSVEKNNNGSLVGRADQLTESRSSPAHHYCPNGHISFRPTTLCSLCPIPSEKRASPNPFVDQLRLPLYFHHHCPNGHISFSQKNFCCLADSQKPSPELILSPKPQTNLVLRIRGGGGIEVPISEIFVPKIHFDLVETEDQAKEPPRLTFFQLLQKINLADPSFSDISYAQIDTISNKFTTKNIEEFLKSFLFTFQSNQVTLLLILKTQNIPRNPVACLARDTRPFIQMSLPFLTSVHLNLQPGKPGVLVAVLSKATSPAPISQVYFNHGIVQPLSGTSQVIGIETVIRIKGKEAQHKQAFSETFPGMEKEIDNLIVCGKKVIAECLFLRFIFFTRRENFSSLLKRAEESWENAEKSFWIADINLLDSICDPSFDFFLASGYIPDFLPSGAKKVMEISKSTTTKVLSLIPKNHSSLIIVTEKGTQDFSRSLLENSFKVFVLSSKGAKEIRSNSGLMVYPIPNSKDGKNVMSPEELKGILEQLLQTKKVEARKNGFRIFCDPETLETWRNFEGFLSYQKVRMCKEKEKERERSSWWTSLRGPQKDEINEKRRVSFLRLASPPVLPSLPGAKRRREDEC